MKKERLAQGLNGLIPGPMTAEAPAQSTEASEAPQKVKGNYKTVCYSIPPELAEKVKRVAYIDRKTIGAVVTEAFELYFSNWEKQPAQPEPERKL